MGENNQTSEGRSGRKGSAVQRASGADASVKSTDERLEEIAENLSQIHGFISLVGVKRHRKNYDVHIENSISFLSQALVNLTNYLKNREEAARKEE